MILSDLLVLVASLTYFGFYAYQDNRDQIEEEMVFNIGWVCCGAAVTILGIHVIYLLVIWISQAVHWAQEKFCPAPCSLHPKMERAKVKIIFAMRLIRLARAKPKPEPVK